MKISVITTFFNDAGTLKRTLDSVVAQQTGYPVEYIIVNDHGGDGSEWLLKGWRDTAHVPDNFNVRELSTPRNLGCGGARHFGISQATGDALMFLDADDFYLRTDFIQRAADALLQNDADVACFGAQYHHGPASGDFRTFAAPAPAQLTGPEAFLRLFLSDDIRFNVWDKIFRRRLAEEIPYSEAPVMEDMRTVPFWLLHARKVVLETEVMVYYTWNPRSIIRRDPVATRLNTMAASLDVLRRLTSTPDDAERRRAVVTRIQPDVMAILKNEPPQSDAFKQTVRYYNEILNELDKTTKAPAENESSAS